MSNFLKIKSRDLPSYCSGRGSSYTLADKGIVLQHLDEVKALLECWDIVMLADGMKIDGAGYGNKIMAHDGSSIGHALIVKRSLAGGAEEGPGGCPRAAGRALVATLGLAAAFFDSTYDRCYCAVCYKAEWPDTTETDGPFPYVIPRGWVRFGLKLPVRAEAMGREFFRDWSVSFHGAAAGVCKQILESGMMAIPGDRLLSGSVLQSGRCAGRQDRVFYTSPSVCYAGLRFYATPTRFVDAAGRAMLGQAVLQCRQKAGSFSKQAETMGFGTRWPDHEVCRHTPADEVERLSDCRSSIVPYGLLVRVWPADGPEPAFLRSPVDP
mmetsp:Transcript_7861/g.16770  ORF Transcript_7861/g.16770 Transcript_7861/m.16770 type:complete len:324 (-) Transcript_7861:369-1340(-)